MKLTILGSGTCIPDPDRNCAGYLVTIHGEHLLFDSGPGTLHQLARVGIPLTDIHHLFYTHTHLDHVADLFPFLFANKNMIRQGFRSPIHIYGPKNFRNFYLTMAEALGKQVISGNYQTYLREIFNEDIKFKGWKISTCEVPHTPHSNAYRIDTPDGKSLAYSGDTDYSEALIDLARNCDLLILDCASTEGMKTEGHLMPSEAAKIAVKTGCRQLILSHFYPPVFEKKIGDIVRKIYPGSFIIARDLMEVML